MAKNLSSRRIFLKGIGLIAAGTTVPIVSFANSEYHSIQNPHELNDDSNRDHEATYKESPIFEAIAKGNKTEVIRLLNQDPGLYRLRDSSDRSTFTVAYVYAFPEIAAMLIEKGYEKDIFDAAAEGDIKGIRQYYNENQGVINTCLRSGFTPLHIACQAGQIESAETLVGIGANKELSSNKPDNYTPLYFAIIHPKKTVANALSQVMLGNGANPNALQKDAQIPIHLAAETGNEFIVSLLIRKGADVYKKNNAGKTALDIAIENKYVKISTLLKDAGKAVRDMYITRYKNDRDGNEVKREDNYGIPQVWINEFVTLAHFNLEKTKELYTRCPELLMTRATWDEIAVEGPAHLGNVPNMEFLLEKGSPLSICTAVSMGYSDKVKSMLKENLNLIHERGPHDFPLLLYTAFGKEKVDLAEYLLQNGAGANGNVRGRSTLHEAAVRGHYKLCELLLQNGADANMKGTSSFMPGTPTKAASMGTTANKDKVIDLIKKFGGKEMQWKKDYE